MKNLLLFILIIGSTALIGQNEIEEIVRKGIQLHNEGKFDDAILTYNEALTKDKNSSLVNYEMGFTYFAKGEYKTSIKYMDKVIKKGDHFVKEAYMSKGSSLDLLGKTKEAIKIYEKTIKKYEGDYLLYYNLALTQYNIGEFENSETNLKSALALNPSHPTSNFLLGLIKLNQDRRVESLLAIHFFLLLEPNTKRSMDAIAMMNQIMGSGVTRKDEKNIEITLNSLALEDDFSTANMMLSLLGASSMTEKNKGKTKQELFYENTKSFFSVLSEQKEGKKGFWWELYIPFYSKLLESGNLEAYCYYITQSNSELEQLWIETNNKKMEQFYSWIEGK